MSAVFDSASRAELPTSHAAVDILRRLFHGLEPLPALRLWDGKRYGSGDTVANFTLVLRDPAVLRRLVIERNPLVLANAYIQGALDVEGDIYGALALTHHIESLSLSRREQFMLLRDALRLPRHADTRVEPDAGVLSGGPRCFAHRHSRRSDRKAIAFHYDVSNAFYGLWLDPERVYSCAYFEHSDDILEAAQRNKLEHICRKLRLRPGERLLDIGCGWGALLCRAAREHGVRAHGITLSERQFEYARERVRAEGLSDRVTVELCDYRDLRGTAEYDKVVSVGMFEHVGLANLPTYYAIVHRVLRPGGLFLNHGITCDGEGWKKTIATEFINRYVFPDGELDRVSNILLGMERVGFEIHDVEGLRPHYALTLRHWVARLEAAREAAVAEVGEAVWRVWHLYMAACALQFEAGGTGVYQILASRRRRGTWPVPLTRADLYRADAARTAAPTNA